MQIDFAAQPAYTVAYLRMTAGEEVEVEPGALVAMSAGIEVVSTTGGGIAKAAFRKVVGNESFFLARYRARFEGAWVALAPRFPGDITAVDIHPGQDLLLQSGSFLAATSGVHTDVRFGGVGSAIQREGVTLLHASGEGKLLICAYGGIQHFTLGSESLIVDTGHLVGFTSSMEMRIGPLSGVVTSALTGEGLVSEIKGPGEVFIQTRSEQSLRSWLFPDREQDRR
jgi:uncharacterized protein (TIGR00266 family)